MSNNGLKQDARFLLIQESPSLYSGGNPEILSLEKINNDQNPMEQIESPYPTHLFDQPPRNRMEELRIAPKRSPRKLLVHIRYTPECRSAKLHPPFDQFRINDPFCCAFQV